MDLAIEILKAVFNFAVNMPPELWAGIFGALGISALVEALKAKWTTFVKAHATSITSVLSILISVITLGGEFIIANPALFGTAATAILGAANIAYHFPIVGIKALHAFFSEFKEYKATKANEVKAPVAEPYTAPQNTNEFAY